MITIYHTLKRLKNTKNTIAMWKCRNISLKGKITVTNTLTIPPPPPSYISQTLSMENRHIAIQNKHFRWQKWLQYGIGHMRDILSDKADFLSHEGLNQRYGVQCNFYTSYKLGTAYHLHGDKSFVKAHQIVQYVNILFLAMIPYRPYVCVALKTHMLGL